MDEVARNKVRTAIREAILSLFSNALDYTMELSVKGLLGVTVDKEDVFLVNVNEIMQSAEYEDLLAEPKSTPAPEEKVRLTFQNPLFAIGLEKQVDLFDINGVFT